MRRELIGIVRVGGGEGEHRLAARAHAVERLADVGDGGLAAAGEAVEIERDRLDARVAGRRAKSADEIAQPRLADRRRAAGREEVERLRLGGLLGDAARELEVERAPLAMLGFGEAASTA